MLYTSSVDHSHCTLRNTDLRFQTVPVESMLQRVNISLIGLDIIPQ